MLPHSSALKESSPSPDIYAKVQTRKYLNYLAIFTANGSFFEKLVVSI